MGREGDAALAALLHDDIPGLVYLLAGQEPPALHAALEQLGASIRDLTSRFTDPSVAADVLAASLAAGALRDATADGDPE